MIKTFKHKGLEELWATGASRYVAQDQLKRIGRRLDALDQAISLEAIAVPRSGFHPLHGNPQRYAVDVSGPWRITFGWEGQDAIDVDLEQYH